MADLHEGQLVRIVGGSYRHYGTGIFIERCGKVSCRVKVTGDNQSERTLRLTSIEAVLPPKATFFDSSRNVGTSENTDPSTAPEKHNSAPDNSNKKSHHHRLIHKCFRKHVKLVADLQDNVDELRKIINNMHLH
jgi:hypothetical protein